MRREHFTETRNL